MLSERPEKSGASAIDGAEGRRGSPRISLSEVAVVSAAALGIVLLMHASFLPHIGTHVLQELRDPTLQAWQIAWDGHALLTQPLRFFDANIYYPLERSLAFSDALIGYAPAGLIGSSPQATVLRYNIMFLFAYALPFVGAYLLARELGAGRLGAAVAGVAFAFAPFRLAHMRHLHVLSSGGMALSLFLLVRGYRGKKPGLVVAGWLTAAWQVSLGFTLGLQLFYLLAVLGALAIVLFARGKGFDLTKPVLIASAVGIVIFLGWTANQAYPYIKVLDDHPQARRSIEEVSFFSPPPRALLSAPSESYLWGSLTEERRSTLPFAQEKVLHPGALVVILGVVGLFAPGASKRLRIGLLVGVAVTATLCLGLAFAEGRFGYRFLYDHLPGWQGIRTPGRVFTLTTLGLGLLAGLGATWLIGLTRRFNRVVPLLLGGILVAGVLAEGAGTLERYEVPLPPSVLQEVKDPLLHLPSDDQHDSEYMLWSTAGFPLIVNGVSGFNPLKQAEVRAQMESSFPDPTSVALLRELGVRTVLLHRDRAAGTDWDFIAQRDVPAGLGVTRTEAGSVLVFEIESASRAIEE